MNDNFKIFKYLPRFDWSVTWIGLAISLIMIIMIYASERDFYSALTICICVGLAVVWGCRYYILEWFK